MRTGELLLGKYLLEAKAGTGSMGVVYRARDVGTGAPVAVKILRDTSEEGAARFQREAEILAELRHPAIVGYLAHGRSPDGHAYIVMEWLDGETLKQRLDRAPLSMIETAELGRSIATALAATHARGIVHRDLKPANVFLVRGACDAVKILDYGVAGLKGRAPTVTESGTVLGTPAYMSPEQARDPHAVDARSDLYSVGAILFRCLAGRPPFEAPDSVSMLLSITTGRAPPLAELVPSAPGALAGLVDAMLSPDRATRPQEASSVYATLTAVLGELGRRSLPSGADAPHHASPPASRAAPPASVAAPSSRVANSPSSKLAVAVVAGGFAIVAIAGIATLLVLHGRKPAKNDRDDDDARDERHAREEPSIRDPVVHPLSTRSTSASGGLLQPVGDPTPVLTDVAIDPPPPSSSGSRFPCGPSVRCDSSREYCIATHAFGISYSCAVAKKCSVAVRCGCIEVPSGSTCVESGSSARVDIGG